jgi:hypothetical protein
MPQQPAAPATATQPQQVVKVTPDVLLGGATQAPATTASTTATPTQVVDLKDAPQAKEFAEKQALLSQQLTALQEKLAAGEARLAELNRQTALLKLQDEIRASVQPGAKTPSDEAVTRAVTKLDPNKDKIPTAEDVLTYLKQEAETKKQAEFAAGKEMATKIRTQLNSQPPQGSLADTQKWATDCLQFRETLTPRGQEIFDKMITLKYNKDRQVVRESYTDERISPKDYFATVVASKAIAKMENFVSPTGNSIDANGLSQEMRSFKDLQPETLKIIASSTVASDANRLLFGNDHAEFTARMSGEHAKAEAIHLYDLLSTGTFRTSAGKTELQDTLSRLKTDKLMGEVSSEYKKLYGISPREAAEKAVGDMAKKEVERLKAEEEGFAKKLREAKQRADEEAARVAAFD